MSIRKFSDLQNESDSKFDRIKAKRKKIEERFDDTTHNDQPADDALQFLNKKVDECIDSINTNRAKTTFPGFGTSSTTCLRGNTTTISDSQANAITANTAKTGISDGQADAITANTAKMDGRYIYFPIIANFSGNINTEQFIPLSDGETEGTNNLQRKNNFIAPYTGTLHKVFVRSNASLQTGGRGVTLTGKLHLYPVRDDSRVATVTATTTTGPTADVNILTFSNASFTVGQRLLIGLQAPLNDLKNYYVTALFKLDQNSI